MLRTYEPAKAFDGVAWNTPSTAVIKAGRMINAITLIMTNFTAAAINYIEVMEDGNSRFGRISGANLLKVLKYLKYDVTTDTSRLRIPFVDLTQRSLADELLTALTTMAGQNVELTVALGDDPDGAHPSTPKMSYEVEYSEYGRDEQGNFPLLAEFKPRWRFVNLKSGLAGQYEVDNLHTKKDGTESIRRIHFLGDGAHDYITAVRVEKDNLKKLDRTVGSIRQEQRDRGFDPQDKVVTLDFVQARDNADMLNTGHNDSLLFTLTLSHDIDGMPTIIETVEHHGQPDLANSERESHAAVPTAHGASGAPGENGPDNIVDHMHRQARGGRPVRQHDPRGNRRG